MSGATPKNVVIVGMPRSGTSLTTSLLVGAGYYPGPSQREATEANPFGYFQSLDMMAMNAALFGQVGFPFHNTWLYDRISDAQLARIADLEVRDEHRQFLRHCGEHAPWTWKDPRLCVTLAFWRKLIDFGSTRILLVRRDKAAIYNSFVVQNWLKDRPLTREDIYERTDQHIQAAVDTLERYRLPWMEVWYEELLEHPVKVIGAINAFTGARIDPERVKIRRDLNHSSLRHAVTGRLVGLARQWPGAVRVAKALLPEQLTYLVFPERRHLRGREASKRAR